MASFEKIKLATGEFRSTYIQRRLREQATAREIVDEINAPGLFSGKDGVKWGASVVYAESHKLSPPKAAESETLIGEAHPSKAEFVVDKVADENTFKVVTPNEAGPAVPLDDGITTRPEMDVPAEYEGILDPADIAEIHAEAAKLLNAEQRKTARAALLKKVKADLERAAMLALLEGTARGDQVDVYIDLATYAADIRLDGQRYLHGSTHRVSRHVAAVLHEQMQRSWQHQESISGRRDDFNRKRSIAINGRTGVVQGAEGLRV